MPLQATSGAASYDAFGGGVAAVPNYIESCFSTYLYTGNGSTQTITNGIDLAGKGGLVWTKSRGGGASNDHILKDTVRGGANWLYSNNTFEQQTGDTGFSFGSTGFTLSSSSLQNQSTINHASWTFRKQPKFFDVVTWSGKGMSIAHSLETTPATIILKRTNAADDWYVVHRSANGFFSLNTTNAASGTSNAGIGTDTNTAWVAATATTCNFENFTVTAGTYVAYLFAHNAGGFGLTGTDNVISCGGYTGNGAAGGQLINLGYEAQLAMVKNTSSGGDWWMMDNMRGWTVNGDFGGDATLSPNSSSAEANQVIGQPDARGFRPIQDNVNQSGHTYIYIAIRRGPMKVPTSGTSVFSPIARTGTGSIATVNVGFAPDFLTTFYRTDVGQDKVVFDRLRGPTQYLDTAATTQEINVSTNGLVSFNNTSFTTNANGYANNSGSPFVNHVFGRAPSFFDEVCYTGTGSARTVAHNLGVAPELIFVKCRSSAVQGLVYNKTITASRFLTLFSSSEGANASEGPDAGPFNSTEPTSSVFSVGTYSNTNGSGSTYVAYLFATCAGVSKCGTFTGNGSSQTINCGFTGGARFVMIKATSTTGDWMVADSARGIVSGNDPYLELNNTNAEVTGEDWLDTDSTGFVVNQVSSSNANTNGVTYIYLAIA